MKLGGNDTKKVILSSYGDDDQDETLFILVKEFSMMIENGDLLKDEDIGEEKERHTLTALKKRNKLKATKETFR